jgi:ATP-dependent helicase HrpB
VSPIAEELRRAAGRALGSNAADDEATLRRALLLGFPDRLARRREPGSPRFVLASGHGARLAAESGVREAELIAALDVSAGRRGEGSEALVRVASAVERSWVEPTRVDVAHRFDAGPSTVRAVEARYYDALLLEERAVAADPERAAPILVAELRRRGLSPRDEDFVRRARFAGVELDLDALRGWACAGRTVLPDLDLVGFVPDELRRQVESRAPEQLRVPSGRSVRLEYAEDGSVGAAVKLQELFGLGETPRVDGRPVLLSLLAPSGRPVQTTRDLASFWNRTYPEVRKELRGRYPKHPWPEDPWTAPPTARARPRPRRR